MNFSLYNSKKDLTIKDFNSSFVEIEVIKVYNNIEVFSHVYINSKMPIFFRYSSTFMEVNINKAFNKIFKD